MRRSSKTRGAPEIELLKQELARFGDSGHRADCDCICGGEKLGALERVSAGLRPTDMMRTRQVESDIQPDWRLPRRLDGKSRSGDDYPKRGFSYDGDGDDCGTPDSEQQAEQLAMQDPTYEPVVEVPHSGQLLGSVSIGTPASPGPDPMGTTIAPLPPPPWKPGGYKQTCEIHTPPPAKPKKLGMAGALNPPVPTPPPLHASASLAWMGGASHAEGPGGGALKWIPDGGPDPGPGDPLAPADSLKGPEAPLCPPGFRFDYNWQSCWHDDGAPPTLPHEPHPHACKCTPGYSYLAPFGKCWKRGTSYVPAGWWTPAKGVGLFGPPNCPPGKIWNESAGQCLFVQGPKSFTGSCPYHQKLDEQFGVCVADFCEQPSHTYDEKNKVCVLGSECITDQQPREKLKMYKGDCSQSKINLILDLINVALERLDPVARMIDVMTSASKEYRKLVWDWGANSSNTFIREASPQAWLGNFSDEAFEILRESILVAHKRLQVDMFRCMNVNWIACEGAVGAYYTLGRVHLCPHFFDNIADPQLGSFGMGDSASLILHEVLHFAMFGVAFDTPRDYVSTTHCQGKNHRCRGAENARKLAINMGLRAWVTFVNPPKLVEVPAAVVNIDNIVSWVWSRWGVHRACSIPHSAPAPF